MNLILSKGVFFVKYMKKITALLVALVLILGFSGCGRLQIEKELLSFNGEMV